jgi:hypothetical protein
MALKNITLFLFMLIAIVEAIIQMQVALEEADIEKFVIWTGIASIIASLPMSF